MLISIKTVSGLMTDELANKLNTLGQPAVLLDKDLKVVAKNRESLEFAPFLKPGTKIYRYLPEGDAARIAEMRPRDILVTSVSSGGTGYGVNIICGIDCRLAVFQTFSELCAEVLDKYIRMSGYDAEISETEANDYSPKPNNRISKRLADIIESACSRHSKLFALPFFNSAAALNRLISEIGRAAPRKIGRISLSLSADELISEGSEKDFILMTAFMISFCFEISDGEEISVSAENQGSELVFCISCKSDASVYGIARLGSFRNGGTDVSDALDGQDFRAYMLKLLADANLWDISAYSDGGRLGIRLCTPYVRSGEEFMVNDAINEYIRSIVSAVF